MPFQDGKRVPNHNVLTMCACRVHTRTHLVKHGVEQYRHNGLGVGQIGPRPQAHLLECRDPGARSQHSSQPGITPVVHSKTDKQGQEARHHQRQSREWGVLHVPVLATPKHHNPLHHAHTKLTLLTTRVYVPWQPFGAATPPNKAEE
jgi:hypothetical protein